MVLSKHQKLTQNIGKAVCVLADNIFGAGPMNMASYEVQKYTSPFLKLSFTVNPQNPFDDDKITQFRATALNAVKNVRGFSRSGFTGAALEFDGIGSNLIRFTITVYKSLEQDRSSPGR